MSDEVVTVALPERLDSATSAEVEATVMAVLREGVAVVVDGANVVYMSAAGVRVLVDAYRKATEQGARLVLCRFTGAAAECLAVSGFGVLLPVMASVEEAMRKLGNDSQARPRDRLHHRHNAS
jgi:anti-sigma B factor antagonist